MKGKVSLLRVMAYRIVRAKWKLVCIVACLMLFPATKALAQFPQSVICEFERIATAELDSNGKLASSGESSKGEMVISNLNSDGPLALGNVGAAKLRVLARSEDTIWLAEITPDGVVGVITLFFKTSIIMYTKHETLRALSGEAMPFGFVEIGKFRPLK